MNGWLRPATREDLHRLIRDMRPSDVRECTFNARATGRWHPGWTIAGDLVKAWPSHPHWAMDSDRGLIGMGGANPLAPGVAAIWFLGTRLADAEWRMMTRLCARFIAMKQAEFPRMGNVLPQGMATRRRWLAHLGFDFPAGEAQQGECGLVTFWTRARSTAPTPE